MTLTVMDFDDGDSSDDFLGLASIPVNELVHGRCMEVTLQLRDEDGYTSARSRGSLDIEVEWIADPGPEVLYPDREEEEIEDSDSSEEESDEEPPDPIVDRPIYVEEYSALERMVHESMKDVLSKIVPVCIFVEQMVKLDQMASEAHAQAKAEQAKHYDLRITAVIKEQYRPLELILNQSTKFCRSSMHAYITTIEQPLMAYARCTKQEEEVIEKLNAFRGTVTEEEEAEANFLALRSGVIKKKELLQAMEDCMSYVKNLHEAREEEETLVDEFNLTDELEQLEKLQRKQHEAEAKEAATSKKTTRGKSRRRLGKR